MPTYEYICDKCKETKEEFHQMVSVPEFIKCKCGQDMKRQFGGGAGFVFKGEKWNE
jgi:putative FmdB family regulatory protein